MGCPRCPAVAAFLPGPRGWRPAAARANALRPGPRLRHLQRAACL